MADVDRRELKVLQGIRLKGRVDEATLAATVGQDRATLALTVADLSKAGMVLPGKTLKISPQGRARLDELLAQERSGIDTAAITGAYNAFRHVNVDFKALVSDWQTKDGQPNTHQDADYDAAVLARLEDVHRAVVPIIAAAAAWIPRLSTYADKLTSALEKIRAGDTTWLARPIIDSYHTVWFELHEELIGAAGITRKDEAKAGHAQ
jgi:hypothetical protein